MLDRTITDGRGRTWSVEIPQTLRERGRGLLGRPELGPGRAMLFEHTRAIHTVGMRFPILVAFLDAQMRVRWVARARPGRPAIVRLRARHVMEFAADADVRVGDRFDHSPSLRAIRRRWISEVPE